MTASPAEEFREETWTAEAASGLRIHTGTQPSRELNDAAAADQARALAAYVRRGGLPNRWFETKGFSDADRSAVLAALSKVTRPVRW
jgi:hypothetical protein